MYECSFLGNTKSSFFLELKGLIKIVGSTNKIFKEILHKKKSLFYDQYTQLITYFLLSFFHYLEKRMFRTFYKKKYRLLGIQKIRA